MNFESVSINKIQLKCQCEAAYLLLLVKPWAARAKNFLTNSFAKLTKTADFFGGFFQQLESETREQQSATNSESESNRALLDNALLATAHC